MKERFTKARDERLRLAAFNCEELRNALEEIIAGTRQMESMVYVRHKLSELNRWVHEAQAYHNASKEPA